MALKDSFAQAERVVRDQNDAATAQAQLQQQTALRVEKCITLAYDNIAQVLYKAICDKVAEQLVARQGERVTVDGYITNFYHGLKIPNDVLPRADYDKLLKEIENSKGFFEKLCKKHQLSRNYSDIPCISLEHTTTAYPAGNALFGNYSWYKMFLTHHGKEILHRVQTLAEKDGITVKACVLQTRQKKNEYGEVLWTKYSYKYFGFKLKEPWDSSTSHRLAFSYSYTGEYTAQK